MLKHNILVLKNQLDVFVREFKTTSKIKKTFLISSISNFSGYIISYNNTFVNGFMDILQNTGENTIKSVGKLYNADFRMRYNELASKYEDFLKRAQRELNANLESPMPRVNEFQFG
jgi:hypothetical protein